ncbi:hypothetical protein ABPG74_018474 [Tetrahymena malaccensis]
MDIGQDEAQLVLQHKKDQFRVEIRKKKTDNLIQQKRLKLFNRNLSNQDNSADNDSSNKSDQNANQDPQSGVLNQQQKVSTLDVQVIRDIEDRLLQSQKDNNIEQMRSILMQLVKIVGTYPSPINQMFMTGLPKFIIQIVNKHGPVNDSKCRIHAAHILANLTSGTPMQLQELFQLDLIHILIEQIQSKDIELADHVIWAFNNVLIDNHQPENLARIFQERPLIIEDLCYYFTTSCNNPNIQYQLISSVILSIYCLSRIHKSTQQYYNQLRIAVPYLAKLLDVHHPKEPNTLINNTPSLSNKNKQMIFNSNNSQNQMNSENFSTNNISSMNNNSQASEQQVKQKFLSSGDLKMCALIITDLSEGDPRVISDMLRIQVDRIMLRYLEQGIDVNEHFLTFVIRTLANMSSGNEFQTDQLLQKDIYSYLNRFLEHPKESIRKDVCWLISNLSAGNPSQIDVFLNKNMLQTLIQRLNTEQSINVKKEILFALSNATAQATKEQISKMVSNGLLRVFSDNLDTQYQTELLIEILEGIENVMILGRSDDINNNQNAYTHEFEGSGCQRKIQYLYYQKSNQTIVEISDRILRAYGTN